MKLLLCSETALVRELGAAKVLIELADALRADGHECELLGPDALGVKPVFSEASRIEYCDRLRACLARMACKYDVVEYNHAYLPFARSEFSLNALFVARSVLLAQHTTRLRIPASRGLRSSIGRIVRGRSRCAQLAAVVLRADQTVMNADLVNVSNDDDRAELIRRGIDPAKIVVLPFGLSRSRRAAFEKTCAAEVPARPVVAFVGTFDYRKGAADFPRLVARVLERVPDAKFRLLGTAGMFQTEQQVLSHFPRKLRGAIDVIPRFDPDALPQLLADCSVGVFPSYVEGFGFGVLEMLAAAIPVIAYDAPGPPMMLGPASLAAPGDVASMAEKVVRLLLDRVALLAARQAARQAAGRFDWDDIARRTVGAYQAAIDAREQAVR